MSLQDFRKDTNSFDPTVSHDDLLYQLLSGLPTTASWPDMSAGDHFDHHNLRHHQIPFTDDSSFNFKSPIIGDNNPIQNPFHGFAGSLTSDQTQAQNYGPPGPAVPVMGQEQTASATAGGGGGAPSQRRQRVRARRGQATDPHSIAERLRRERIAERLKALKELVPNANSTDKASMLDDIVDYVKFLQLQVKVLSMSRLGGATGASIVTEGHGAYGGGGNEGGRSSNGSLTSSSIDSTTVTEKQVVKLMEENMGSAMQYLQGKGLCLMPISLATTISTARMCHPSDNHPSCSEVGGPYSPDMPVLRHSANGLSVKESP